MPVRKFLIVFFFQQILAISGYAFQLSPQAKVSIITGAPGAELYMIFGHTGIRVQDPLSGMDVIYNYGIFDIDTPNFLWKYLTRTLLYQINKEDFRRFQVFYAAQGRNLWEQVLNLTPEERQKLFDFLENNLRPQNRYYLYDFFYDNCATRVRDALIKALPNQIIYQQEGSTNTHIALPSFRDLLQPYLQEAWVNFGVNLIIGLPADAPANAMEQMFLPDHLLTGIERAKINREGKTEALAQAPKTLIQGMQPRQPSKFTDPIWVFGSLAVLLVGLSALSFKKGKILPPNLAWRILDALLFLVAGLSGCIFVFMWVASDHIATDANLNLLWALPTHLLVAFFILFNYRPSWLNYYLAISALVCLVLLLTFRWAFPQVFPYPVWAILCVYMVRSRMQMTNQTRGIKFGK